MVKGKEQKKNLRLIIKLLYFSERNIAQYKTNYTGDIVIATKFYPYPFKLFYPSSLLNALRASLERLKV